MIELINPSGERKIMNLTEYVELLNKYVTTKSFKAWSDRRNIAGMIKLGGEMKVSGSAVEMFLRESGYTISMIKG
ncbi:hypothetical protein [Butyricimonas paravirosa]|jgi:hypothetical protein bfra3_11681|uniref:hypothetical protein n=1 Tax=Butyricimonas paravirosa TaxID=1472417 RepID=UPI000E51A105|nr:MULTISPECIES: hypothetical protein [unclassified Odoribacter]RGG48148.1 hypothetical protein DWX82_08720 [Odoribacter sp. AF21-41]RHH94223.1 hypothetical protein DW186_12375 [Odoribacter sp. AM16-33]